MTLTRRRFITWSALACTVALTGGSGAAGAPGAAAFPLHRAVLRELGELRPYVVRLSGQTTRSACDVADPASQSVRCRGYAVDNAAAERALRLINRGLASDAESRNATAADDRTWAAATVDLIAGPSQERLASIVRDLEILSERYPNEPALHNDLAVAYRLKHDDRHDAVSLIAAVDQIEVAFGEDSTSDVIAYNRAILRANLGLDRESEDAIRTLARAHGNTLAQEATESTLSSETASRDGPPGLRERALDTLLIGWSDAAQRRDAALAERALARLQAAGDSLVRRYGDSSVARVALEVRERAARDSAHLFSMARDVGAFVAAQRQSSLGEYAAAGSTFASILKRGDAPPAVLDWSRVGLANVRQFQAKYDEAEGLFAAAERGASAHSELALSAQVAWGRALSDARQGHLGEALQQYQQSAAIFQRLNEPWNQAFMRSQYGDVLFQLGDDDAAFAAKLEAIQLQRRGADATSRISTLMAFGKQLGQAGFDHASLAVFREAHADAAQSRRTADRGEAAVRLARALFVVGEGAQARAVLDEAAHDIAEVSDPLLRDRMRMEVWRDEAQLPADSAPRVAIARLDSTAAYFRRQGILFSLSDPLTTAASLRLRIGDVTGARANLDEAVDVIDRQARDARDAAAEREMRAARRRTYAELAQLELSEADTAKAFAMVERGRTNGDVSLAALDPGVVYLSYAMLENECVLWIASNRSLRLVTIATDTVGLVATVRSYLGSIVSPSDSARTRSEERKLYDLLVAPAAAELAHANEIVVVADGPLQEVPFAALRDSSGSRLIEHLLVSYSSSVRSRVHQARAQRALVVGNPAFDARLFDGLPRLSSANAEIDHATRTLPAPHTLVGAAATKASLLGDLPIADMLYFAGHASLVPRLPEQSHLVLAAASGNYSSNVLTAAEIERLRLPTLQVVVLSACGTAQATSIRDDSGNGLAEAFLSAGARAVIASSWEADDAATARLMTTVQDQLARGASAEEALRAAQLVQLRTGGAASAATWAGFRVFRR